MERTSESAVTGLDAAPGTELSSTPVQIGSPGGEELDRDAFCRMLIGKLAQTLQDVVGLEESAGFIAVVGQLMAEKLDDAYRRALGVDRLDPVQVADVLVDLKRRIDGGFRIESADADRIVLTNDRCPFGERVLDRPSLCMMTSNVFGSITAENLGYAKVSIEQAIATGHENCRVIVWTKPVTEALASAGREYFAGPESVAGDSDDQ